jgi:predicted transcriptional regulator
MTLLIELNPELEVRLRAKALQSGQDVKLMAAALIQVALEWQDEDLAESIAAIQSGINDFETGKFQSFEEFSHEKRQNSLTC